MTITAPQINMPALCSTVVIYTKFGRQTCSQNGDFDGANHQLMHLLDEHITNCERNIFSDDNGGVVQ